MKLAVLFVLAVASIVVADPLGCYEAANSLINNNRSTLVAMMDATGKGVNDLGKWDQCRDLGSSLTHYCLLQYDVNVTGFANPYLGICAPAQCTTTDIGTVYLDILKRNVYSNDSYVALVAGALLYFAQESKGKGQFMCYPYDRPTPSHDLGAVVMIIICFLIVAVVVIGTLIDGALSQWWPEVVVVTTEKEPLLPSSSIQEVKVVTRGNEMPRSKILQFFLAFSVVRNWQALLGPSPPSLSFLNGLRAMSIMWVLLGHSLVYMNYAGIINFAHVVTIDILNAPLQAFPGAEFAVDTFFWLSGFLVTYLTLSELKSRRPSVLFWGMYYFHRIWRLTPLYMFTFFFYIYVSPYLAYGPLWNEYTEKITATCGTHWWTNILYVNNFIPSDWNNQCFLWGWYLAVDMQLYIIAPIILIAYHRKRIVGWVLVLALLFVTVGLNFYYAKHYDLVWNGTNADTYMSKVYGKPYTRASPWLLGIAVAFLYHEKRQLNRIFVYVGYVISALFMFAVVYGPTTVYREHVNGLRLPKNEWSQHDNLMYYTFSKFAWSVGVAFIMWTFCLGYGGYVRRFLGAQFWNVFARLTYATYLFHPIIMFTVYYSTQQFFDYTVFKESVYFVGILTLAFGMAVVLFVSLERPFVNLEKLFINKKKH